MVTPTKKNSVGVIPQRIAAEARGRAAESQDIGAQARDAIIKNNQINSVRTLDQQDPLLCFVTSRTSDRKKRLFSFVTSRTSDRKKRLFNFVTEYNQN